MILGCVLSGLLIVALFRRKPAGAAGSDGGGGADASGINKGWIGAALISVDVIAVGIIYVLVLLTPAHEFRWPPLRYVQNKIHHWIHDPTVASITGVTNNADEAVEFIVRHNERIVSVRAIGEEAKVGEEGKFKWVDYSWIEDSNKKPVWMMKDGIKKSHGQHTYEVTDEVELNPGRYVLRYKSDGSDSVSLCKEQQEHDSPLKVVVLSRKGLNKSEAPLPVFSACLRVMVTVQR
jgi:hypothetical protein